MRFDVFFSICHNLVNGARPSERKMFENFFDQVQLADELGFQTAWVAESHLSSQAQKTHRAPVIPHFEGEIGLNTDILLLASHLFQRTRKIHVGSAIRNILCNGGPLAHAEAVRFFLSLQETTLRPERRLQLGFAAGRFAYSNEPYGVVPRNQLEEVAWPAVRTLIFREATEIFLRQLKGEEFSSSDVTAPVLRREDFHDSAAWERALKIYGDPRAEAIVLAHRWNFQKQAVLPRESSLNNVDLFIGSHDAVTQERANEILPCGVFNLSITPDAEVEKTHARMKNVFSHQGRVWSRQLMPRTVLVFIDRTPGASQEARDHAAQTQARSTLEVYWKAMEGTVHPERVKRAQENALVGSPETVREQLKRFHPEDRLMLWFDFNCHDNERVKERMKWFWEGAIA